MRLRSALKAEWLELWNLDVVEQAERITRQVWSSMVREALTSALQQLNAAESQLASATEGDDLAAILRAEETVCTVRRLADLVLSRYSRENDAELEAVREYKQRCAHQRLRIFAAEHALKQARAGSRDKR